MFDYIHLAANPEERLKDLPDIAAPFVANFLTAVAENYYVIKKDRKYPPDVLLNCITNWVSINTHYIFQHCSMRAVHYRFQKTQHYVWLLN